MVQPARARDLWLLGLGGWVFGESIQLAAHKPSRSSSLPFKTEAAGKLVKQGSSARAIFNEQASLIDGHFNPAVSPWLRTRNLAQACWALQTNLRPLDPREREGHWILFFFFGGGPLFSPPKIFLGETGKPGRVGAGLSHQGKALGPGKSGATPPCRYPVRRSGEPTPRSLARRIPGDGTRSSRFTPIDHPGSRGAAGHLGDRPCNSRLQGGSNASLGLAT